MKYFIISLVLAVIALGGCGGGGGSSDPSFLGTVNLPGASVSAKKTSTVTAGSNATFQITVTVDPLLTTPNGVKAWISVDTPDFTTGGAVAILRSGTTYIYDVTVMVPNPLLAGSNLYIEVVSSDGSTVQSGPDNFPLN